MKKLLIVATLLLQTTLAQAFELQEFNGSKINLEDKIGQGKWTLIMFWAHDCGVCRAETPAISEFHSRRKDVEVIGVSIDGNEKKHLAQEFLDSTKPSFTSYLGDIGLVAANYEIMTEEGFRGTPTFILFTPDGTLLGNNPGKLSITALEGFIDRNS